MWIWFQVKKRLDSGCETGFMLIQSWIWFWTCWNRVHSGCQTGFRLKTELTSCETGLILKQNWLWISNWSHVKQCSSERLIFPSIHTFHFKNYFFVSFELPCNTNVGRTCCLESVTSVCQRPVFHQLCRWPHHGSVRFCTVNQLQDFLDFNGAWSC